MFDIDEDIQTTWLKEARAEAADQNPLRGYCERVYFERTSCRYRKNHRKHGRRRKYRTHEVELLKFLPSGRCVKVKDLNTPGLDALAEEVFAGLYLPPDVNKGDLFLEYFRKL